MKKLLSRTLLGSMLITGLFGCSSEEDTIVMAPLPEVKSQFSVDKDWSASVGDGVGHYFSRLAPVAAYGKVFVASRDGNIKALEPTSGKTIWLADLEQDEPVRLSGGMTAAYKKLFIGSENGEVMALDTETGMVLWRSKLDGEVLARPVADNNFAIVHTARGMLVALNADTGEQIWTISTEVPNLTLRGDSTPLAVSGGIFWGTANGRLAAAVVEHGQLIWQQVVGNPKGATEIDRLVDSDASPIVIGGTLYTVGINGQLVAIDLRSGSPSWKRSYSSASDMATDGSRLFVLTDKDHLVAVDARSGTELWVNKQLEHRLLTSPMIVDDYLVVGDSLGYLHWLDRATGTFVAQQFVNDSGFAVGPLKLDDGYMITTRNGQVMKQHIE